jgi:hypothetical protein
LCVTPIGEDLGLGTHLENLQNSCFVISLYLLIRRLAVLRGFRLPSGKQVGILTSFQTTVNKKMTKKIIFWLPPARDW